MFSVGWASCCLLLSVLGLQLTQQVVSQNLLHVALHAQSRFEKHRWVAGSEITTRGLERAFSRHPLVASVSIFAPYSYDGLHGQQWDLAIIEGYIGTVPRFIAELRSVSPGVRVMHFCLDTYPSLEVITGLDVDAFLTNSWSLLPQLAALAPTEHVLLAADPEVMRRQAPSPHYAHPVVYLGQMSPTKAGLVPMLEAVKDLGLAIYGLGWDRFDESAGLVPYWKGVLPSNDIAALYSSAGVVLGSTEAAQLQLNMVNNRVFEALACEAPLIIHPPFPGLTSLLESDGVMPAVLAETPAMVRAEVQRLLGNATLRAEMGGKGRGHIMSLHTYDHRVAQVLDFFHRLPGVIGPTAGGNRSAAAPRSARARRNAPHLVLAHPEVEGDDWGLRLGLLPALLHLEEQGLCRVSTVMVRGVEDLVQACKGARLLLLRAPLHHPTETALRGLDDADCGARKGLLLPWGQPEEGMDQWLGGYSLVGHDYPEVPPHVNPVWTFGASPIAAAAAPFSTSFKQHNVTVGITTTEGTTVVVSKEGGRREVMQHVRPETLVALVAGAGQVTIQRDSQEQAGAVISMALKTRALVELQHADPDGPLVRALAWAQGAEEEEAGAGRSALSQRLWAGVSRALHGMPPHATIAIHAAGVSFPEVGGREAARLTVQVSRRHFTMVEHGYWCLLVDGREAGCVGDDVDRVTVSMGPYFNLTASSGMAELQAVLVGGSLEYPEIQYTSAPVYLTAMT